MRIAQPLLRSAMMIALVGGTASAQSPAISFGGMLGVNAARVSDLDLGSADLFNGTASIANRIGVDVGGYVNVHLGGILSLQPELHYTQKGTTLDFGGVGQAAGSLKIKLDYIEVPLLVRVDFGHAKWRPFVTAGPTLALRSSCKTAIESGGTSLSVDCKDLDSGSDDPDLFTKTDIGGSIGGGVAGTLGMVQTGFQVRYSRGFKTIVKDTDPSSDQRPKNSVLSFLVSVGFGR